MYLQLEYCAIVQLIDLWLRLYSLPLPVFLDQQLAGLSDSSHSRNLSFLMLCVAFDHQFWILNILIILICWCWMCSVNWNFSAETVSLFLQKQHLSIPFRLMMTKPLVTDVSNLFGMKKSKPNHILTKLKQLLFN